MSWKLVDHVCRDCLGRILYGPEGYRCSNCGSSSEKLTDLCSCGATLKNGKNAGLRCTRNHHQRPDCPGEIVVTFNA